MSHEADLATAKARKTVSQLKEDGRTLPTSTRNILGTRLENIPESVMAKPMAGTTA